jgi:hypothetical protein
MMLDTASTYFILLEAEEHVRGREEYEDDKI